MLPFGRMRGDIAATVVNFDVAVHVCEDRRSSRLRRRRRLPLIVPTRSTVRSARNADKVLDGNFNAFVLGGSGVVTETGGLGGDLDRDSIEIRTRGAWQFDGADFDPRRRSQPCTSTGPFTFWQFKRAAGSERVNLVEFLMIAKQNQEVR